MLILRVMIVVSLALAMLVLLAENTREYIVVHFMNWRSEPIHLLALIFGAYLVGLVPSSLWHHGQDFSKWRELKRTRARVAALEEELASLRESPVSEPR